MKRKTMAGLMRAIAGGAGLVMAVFSMGIDAQTQEFIPYIPRTGQANEAYIHIGNGSFVAEAFTIDLFDQEGTNVAAAVIFMPPRTRRWVTSRDLEHGSPEKVVFVDQHAPAVGNTLWGRVTPTPSTLDVFLRSRSRRFITEMGQVGISGRAGDVPDDTLQLFNPASNIWNRSFLRIVNMSPNRRRTLTIQGTDDALSTRFVMGCTVPPLGTITLSAVDLENGPEAVDGCYGSWGDGVGKWTVTVIPAVRATSNDPIPPIVAMSLLNREGFISNTSAIRRPITYMGDPSPQGRLDLVIIDGDYSRCPLDRGCVTVRNNGRYSSRAAELDWWTGRNVGGEYVESQVETGTPIPPLAPGETRIVVSTRPTLGGGLSMDYWACVVDPLDSERTPVSCSRRLRDTRF